MDALKGVLQESRKHYADLEKRIAKRLKPLPSGSVKARRISGAVYYYLQERVGGKIVHRYLGKEKPEVMMKDLIKGRNRNILIKSSCAYGSRTIAIHIKMPCFQKRQPN